MAGSSLRGRNHQVYQLRKGFQGQRIQGFKGKASTVSYQPLTAYPLGSLRMRAVISEALPEGVVWSPKEAADLDGISQNSLTSSRPQTIGNGPRFNTTRVTLRKIEKNYA